MAMPRRSACRSTAARPEGRCPLPPEARIAPSASSSATSPPGTSCMPPNFSCESSSSGLGLVGHVFQIIQRDGAGEYSLGQALFLAAFLEGKEENQIRPGKAFRHIKDTARRRVGRGSSMTAKSPSAVSLERSWRTERCLASVMSGVRPRGVTRPSSSAGWG